MGLKQRKPQWVVVLAGSGSGVRMNFRYYKEGKYCLTCLKNAKKF